MHPLRQRPVHFFDLRMLVWLPGLWLMLSNSPLDWLTQLDRQLLYAGVSLSPNMTRATAIDVVELSPEKMQQLLNDPASAEDIVALVDHLAHTRITVGVLLPRLPRQQPLLAEQLLQNAAPDSAIYQAWQTQQHQYRKIMHWLASPRVVIGSNAAKPGIKPHDRIAFTLAPWEKYYAWLPSWLKLSYARPTPDVLQDDQSVSPHVWPVDLHSRTQNPLNKSLLWYNDGNLYPSFPLALLRSSLDVDAISWHQHSVLQLHGTNRLYPLNFDGNITPVFQANTPFTPRVTHHHLKDFLQRQDHSSLLLIGAQNDPVLLDLAGILQSLHTRNYYTSPWWFYGVEKLLLLIILGYLLWLLPKMDAGVALLSTVLLLLLLLVIQLGGQITRAQWLPLGVTMQYLLIGFLLMSLWRQQRRPQQQLLHQHQELAVQLSQNLLQQGQLEPATVALRQCTTSERVLQLLYEIGGQHERKRRAAEALAVYYALSQRQQNFKDVAKRIAHLETKQQIPLEVKDLTMTKTIALADPHSQPQFGRYVIERELGRGAMGVVYLGHDPHIARRVAIKTLDYSRYESAELTAVKARFFREAEAAGRLQHPNIVTVYDVGEEHDLAFIAMDYIAGQPLSDFISSARLLPVQQVFQIVAEVADALAYAHSKQVIHRDIKPGNILYHRDSRKVTVTDFGIARIGSETRTQTGEIIGSPLYMSPEQVKGQPVGEASDIFSLGVTLFQLLSGELPFAGDNIAGLSYQIIHGKQKHIRDLRSQLPGSASRIINKALQKEAQDRYRNAAEMARALNNALQKDF